MFDLVPPSLALGLAGIDPAGLVIALSALAAGARDRFVLWFALIVIVGTALLGTLLTLTIGQRLQELDWTSLLPSDGVGAALELGLAIALLVWAAIRLRRPEARPPRPARARPLRSSPAVDRGGVRAVGATGPDVRRSRRRCRSG